VGFTVDELLNCSPKEKYQKGKCRKLSTGRRLLPASGVISVHVMSILSAGN
jgi:hypothetical protein